MSFEPNQSVECPEALRTRRKRYTALGCGQRYSCRNHRADRPKCYSAPNAPASGHRQISDSTCRISIVLCGQHDGSMTKLRRPKCFSSRAIEKKIEVRSPSLAPSSCACLNFFVRQSKVTRASHSESAHVSDEYSEAVSNSAQFSSPWRNKQKNPAARPDFSSKTIEREPPRGEEFSRRACALAWQVARPCATPCCDGSLLFARRA